MILPSKHLSTSRCLLSIGGEILTHVVQPLEVSDLWGRFRIARVGRVAVEPVTFDWFVTALTFLYAIGAIEFADGRISSGRRSA